MHPWQTSHEPQFSRRTANRQNERKQFTHQRILALHLAEHSRWALARGWQAACDLTEGCEARNAFEAICGQVQPSKKAAHGTLDGLDTHPMQIEAGFKFRCLPTLDYDSRARRARQPLARAPGPVRPDRLGTENQTRGLGLDTGRRQVQSRLPPPRPAPRARRRPPRLHRAPAVRGPSWSGRPSGRAQASGPGPGPGQRATAPCKSTGRRPWQPGRWRCQGPWPDVPAALWCPARAAP